MVQLTECSHHAECIMAITNLSQYGITCSSRSSGNCEVLALLADACARFGQSIAMVTHDPIAASYADRTLILADGRIVHELGKESPENISGYMLAMERKA